MIFVRGGEKHFGFEEIREGVLCETAESFEDGICSTLMVSNCTIYIFSLSICVLCCFCSRRCVLSKAHLRTLEKCRKHSPAARVFYISFMFSNARLILSQCNTPEYTACKSQIGFSPKQPNSRPRSNHTTNSDR